MLQPKAQTTAELNEQIEALVLKNTQLQAQADFCELYSRDEEVQIENFNDNYEFNLLEVKGNTESQTVDVSFTLKHNLPHQHFNIGSNGILAYDEMGNSFSTKNVIIGNNKIFNYYVNYKFPTNQIVKGIITLRNVMSTTDKFSKLIIPVRTKNFDGGNNNSKGELIINNLIINW